MEALIVFLVIAGFSNYRIARMISMEDGAFDIFYRFREWIGRKTTKIRGVEGKRQHWVDAGLNCPLCVGFWTALAIEWLLFGEFNLWRWLTISGIQSYLQMTERQ